MTLSNPRKERRSSGLLKLLMVTVSLFVFNFPFILFRYKNAKAGQCGLQFAMNHRAPRSEEKVDALLVPTDERENFIVIYNVNIPFRSFDTLESSTNIVQRVKNLLMTDYINLIATFQLTASYLLLHRVTGEQRIWTGSFYPRGNAPAYLSAFKRFNPDTFVQYCLNSLDNVENTLLNWPNRGDTSWVFTQIISIIFNVQSIVPIEHPLITKFTRRNHGRKSQIVFALP
jgi:hypothetical protein